MAVYNEKDGRFFRCRWSVRAQFDGINSFPSEGTASNPLPCAGRTEPSGNQLPTKETTMYRTTALFLTWLAFQGQVPSFAQSEEDRMYWADMEGIYWTSLKDGTSQRIIHADTRRPGNLAVDVAGGKMYWFDRRGEEIQWSDLDGSNSQPFSGNLGEHGGAHVKTMDVALDLERRKIYSVAFYNFGDYESSEVFRYNLDGSGLETLLPEGGQFQSLALDAGSGFLYLGGWDGITRIDLSGDSVESVSIDGSWDVAFDPVGNKLYWTDGDIWRSDPDGSDVELLFRPDPAAGTIAVDPEEGKVYWTAIRRVWDPLYGEVLRANLDRSEVEYVVQQAEVVGFDLDLQGRKIYWTDVRGTIHRANIDGTDVEDLFIPPVRAPYSLALNAGTIYWSDVLTGAIWRAGTDGSNPELVVRGLNTPKGIFLDKGKLYWADSGTGKIQSAGLDGSDVMDIAIGQEDPDKVAVDSAHRRIYWTEQYKPRIKRASLEGSNIREFPVDGYPQGIALDVSGEAMYWTWSWEDSTGLRRSSLEVTNVVDLVTGSPYDEDYRAVVIDLAGGKLYWTHLFSPPSLSFLEPPVFRGFINRADLNGSGAEEVADLSGGRYWPPPGLKTYPWALLGNSLALAFSRQTAVAVVSSRIPTSTTLRSSYPNPFNGSTLISYALSASGPVTLVVYNTLGHPIRTLVDQIQDPGLYSVSWQPAEGLASGVYLCRLATDQSVQTRKMTLLR